MSPGLQKFFFVCYLVIYVFAGFNLFAFAKETEHWRPTNGIVQRNTSEKRTIAYSLGKKTYWTSNENILNLLEQRFGVTIPYSRPGQKQSIMNGVDSEIGRFVTVYYDPKNIGQAVVLPGWSAPVVIVALCTAIPLFIMAWMSLVGDWDLSMGCNNY